MTIRITQPGMLSLLQDDGRTGQHQLGLSTGGPIDAQAFRWANKLVNNSANATVIEVSFGGLAFTVTEPCTMAITGAAMPLSINNQAQPIWQSYPLSAGDKIELGFAESGVRCYVAFAGGIAVEPILGSTATVVREGIGGLSDGKPLKVGDTLSMNKTESSLAIKQSVPMQCRPAYPDLIVLRVVIGYQIDQFSRLQQRRFFSSDYIVSNDCDRMGYRLEGPAIKIEQTRPMLSEGISLGAIQIPPSGEPIIMLQDRQTIGGYPKVGSVLSLDLSKLGQSQRGTRVQFEPISVHCAHNALLLAKAKAEKEKPAVILS